MVWFKKFLLHGYNGFMKQEQWDKIKKWFVQFLRRYDTVDELITTNLRYKEIHSFAVSKICSQIAQSLSLEKEEMLLAEVIGLLHDTGRFPQFYTYKTFKDSLSEDHASLGVRVLREENVLECLSREEQEIVIQSIQCHNCFELPKKNDHIDLFSKIIRDSDKLDIFRFILESENKRFLGETNKTIQLELEEKPTYSETMLISILNNRCCLYSNLESIHDFKLLQLSWVYDINFPVTFSMLQERKYIEQICSTLPKLENIQLMTEHVLAYVAMKII